MRSRDRNVEPKCIDALGKVGLDNKQTKTTRERAHETQLPITAPPIEYVCTELNEVGLKVQLIRAGHGGKVREMRACLKFQGAKH